MVMKIDFPKKQKEKILKEFDSALYRKFNQGLDDLCNALDEDNHASLYEVLEETFEDGGAKELRKLVDDLTRVLIQSRKEINNPKIPNNVKPVRFNMPYRPVYKRKRNEDPNQFLQPHKVQLLLVHMVQRLSHLSLFCNSRRLSDLG